MRPIRGAGGGGGGGKGGGGSGGHQPVEAPNTLRSKSTLTVYDLITEGPVKGLVNGGASVLLNGVPLIEPNGHRNFHGVICTVMQGLPDQAVLPDARAVEREIAVAQRVTQASPVSRAVADGNVTQLSVKIRVPALTLLQDNGDLVGTSVRVRIQLKGAPTPFQLMVDETISGKCTSPYERAFLIDVPSGLTYPLTLQVERVTADGDSARINNETWWSSYTEIIPLLLSYPDSCYARTVLDAEITGGQVMSRAFEGDWKIIQIPTNYNPYTRAYTGLWNGTFRVDWTNNPAWVLYDILTHNRYGLGQFIPPGLTDKWALYQIAQRCDELVPSGFGTHEPRFTFNGWISDRAGAYEFVQTFASLFHTMTYWGAGMITFAQDAPGDPVKLVNNTNVVDGNFRYQGSSFSGRHSVVHVYWNDPSNFYRPVPEVWQDDALVQRFGVKVRTIQLLGCTSRGQARRMAKWLLDTEATATEVVEYRAGYDHADLRPGDLIAVADQNHAGIRMGGRVLGIAQLSTVHIDAPVELAGGENYTIQLINADGSVHVSAVANGPGTTSAINLATPLPAEITPGTVWIIGATSVRPRTFRVISNTEVEKGIYQISALYHDRHKYDRVEHDIVFPPDSYTALPSGYLLAPTNLTWHDVTRVAGPSVTVGLDVSWSFSTDPRTTLYEVEVRRPEVGDWGTHATTTANQTFIDLVDPGPNDLYSIRVRGRDPFGRTSAWITLANIAPTGWSFVPEDVRDLTLRIVGGHTLLRWRPIREHDACSYTVRWSPALTGIIWETAILLQDRIRPSSYTTLVSGGTFLVKAVSPRGVESRNAAIVIDHETELRRKNVVAESNEHQGWPGTKVNCQIAGTTLLLDQPPVGGQPLEGSYVTGWFDLGARYPMRLVAIADVRGLLPGSFMINWNPLANIPALEALASAGWHARIEFRKTDDDPSQTPAWSEWRPLMIDEVVGRAVQFRLILRSEDGYVRVEVRQFTTIVDMEDRIEEARSVMVPAGGLSVAFSPLFREPPAVVVTGTDVVTGDYAQITALTEAGFTVRFFSASGAGVARFCNWVAKGYGKRRP
jgi:hypothetical protein